LLPNPWGLCSPRNEKEILNGKMIMKTIALLTLAVALVGCAPKGGSSNDYSTESGRSSTNLPSANSPTVIETNKTNQGTQTPQTPPLQP
jgi:hypothetical protein